MKVDILALKWDSSCDILQPLKGYLGVEDRIWCVHPQFGFPFGVSNHWLVVTGT